MLRQARLRKHALLRDLRARHETQLVLLEMERRGAVDGLRASVAAERAKVAAYQQELAALDASIDSARTAMKRFRAEFEQLRVALLVDRMAKSSQVCYIGRWEGRAFFSRRRVLALLGPLQVAGLAERRRRLAAEAEGFQEAVEAARARAAADEAAKWDAK